MLVCEVDAKGDVASLFEAPPADFTPREVAPGVWAMSMDTEASLREYLKLHLRIPVVGRIGPLAKAFDFVATAAPGVREILTVGKLCYEVRERHYDLVVVDAPASGHVVGQLAAPQAINDLVKVGLIRGQTDWMLDILSDPRQTGLVAVCTPEEMPVTETLELAGRVRDETTVRTVGRGGQPGPARALRPARGGDLRAAARARDRADALGAVPAARSPRCSRRPASPSRCAAPGRPTSQRLRPGCPRACRCSSCPTCSRAASGRARHARWRTSLGEELGL